MGLYDFKTPGATADSGPPPTPAASAGGPPWATLEDAPPITCRQCFNVYFEWEWKPTGDSRVGAWSRTDAWCRARGMRIQGSVDAPRRCLDADPKPKSGGGK